jgi:hypothetical protein
MDTDNIDGKLELYIQVNSNKEWNMVKVNGKKKKKILNQINIKDNIWMIKNMVKGSLIGKVGIII